MHRHTFQLEVKTHLTRQQAELAVLGAFAKRNPDDCEFTLNYTGSVWKPISMAPREQDILVWSKGFAWLAKWSPRFDAWRTLEGVCLENVTHWTEIPAFTK